MGLIADTFRALMSVGVETKQAVATAIPTWQVGMPQVPLINQRSYDQLTRKGYLGSEIVYAACQAVAKSAALPKMVVYDSTAHDAEAIFDHPALEVMEKPNKVWTQFQMWSSTVVSLKINGNAYWERVRDRRGKVVEYWPLRPDRIWIIPDEKDYIRAYEYRMGDRVFTLQPEDVIHFKNPNPLNDYYGLSPLAILAERIDIDVWCREFTTAFFRNAGVPSGLLNIMRSVEPNEREIIRQRFRQQYGGPDGWGNVLVIDNGQASYTKMGMDPVGLGLEDINRQTESKICAVLDVPPSIIWTVLGHSSSSGLNNSNKESDRAQWWTGSLAPMYEDLAQQFTLASADDWPDVDHFDFDLSQVPGYMVDVDALHSRVRADYTAGLVTWDHAAMLLGYPIDKPGWVLLPANMIPTPSEELAHYKKGDTPPGQPDQPPPGTPGSTPPGLPPGVGPPPETPKPGAPPSLPGVPPPGGAQESGTGGPGGKMIETKMTIDGQFEIIPGCPDDAMGHYRSVQLGVCAWCGQDPYVLKIADASSAYDYSSTQMNLPRILGSELVEWAQEHIDPDDLGSGGIETEPHITVKYGLMPNVSASDVARVIKDQSPVRMSFGPNYVFAGQDQGGGVPLYVSVNSDDVGHLNGVIKRSLPNIETHTTYTPHVTIAYLKHDVVNKYVGQRSPLVGMNLTLNDLTYSGADGRQVAIPLSATKILTEGIDTYGGMMVPPDGAPRRKRQRKSSELWAVLDHWHDEFKAGRGDIAAAIDSLDGEPMDLVCWLYTRATGEPPSRWVDGQKMTYKAGNLDALLDYWTDRFDGGHPGDFDDCVSALNDKVDNPPALCAWLHHEATGYWPGHAPDEESTGKLNVNGWDQTIVDPRDELTKRVTEQIRDMEKSLLQSGAPVQPFRPGTQTWLSILEPDEEWKAFDEGQHPRDQNGKFTTSGAAAQALRIPKTAYRLKLPANYGHEDPPPEGETHEQAIARYQKLGYIPPKEITRERDPDNDNLPMFLHGKNDTSELFKDENGNYIQSRMDLYHNPVFNDVMKGVSKDNPDGIPGGIPKADGPLVVTVMGGGAAAGKSTVMDAGGVNVPSRSEAIYQEADEYKTPAPEFEAMLRAGMSKQAAAIVHEESSDIGKQVRDQALKNGQHLVTDALFNDNIDKNAKKVADYKRDGASRVDAHYVVTDLADVADRLVGREADTGRSVPYDRAMGSHTSIATMLPDLLAKSPFDSFDLHDTSSKYSPGKDDNGKPISYAKPIMSWDKETGAHMQDQAAWNEAVSRADQRIPKRPPIPAPRTPPSTPTYNY